MELGLPISILKDFITSLCSYPHVEVLEWPLAIGFPECGLEIRAHRAHEIAQGFNYVKGALFGRHVTVRVPCLAKSQQELAHRIFVSAMAARISQMIKSRRLFADLWQEARIWEQSWINNPNFEPRIQKEVEQAAAFLFKYAHPTENDLTLNLYYWPISEPTLHWAYNSTVGHSPIAILKKAHMRGLLPALGLDAVAEGQVFMNHRMVLDRAEFRGTVLDRVRGIVRDGFGGLPSDVLSVVDAYVSSFTTGDMRGCVNSTNPVDRREGIFMWKVSALNRNIELRLRKLRLSKAIAAYFCERQFTTDAASFIPLPCANEILRRGWTFDDALGYQSGITIFCMNSNPSFDFLPTMDLEAACLLLNSYERDYKEGYDMLNVYLQNGNKKMAVHTFKFIDVAEKYNEFQKCVRMGLPLPDFPKSWLVSESSFAWTWVKEMFRQPRDRWNFTPKPGISVASLKSRVPDAQVSNTQGPRVALADLPPVLDENKLNVHMLGMMNSAEIGASITIPWESRDL